jgi:hypothetical protein
MPIANTDAIPVVIVSILLLFRSHCQYQQQDQTDRTRHDQKKPNARLPISRIALHIPPPTL